MSQYPFNRILLATEQTEFDVGAERVTFYMAQRCGMPLRVVIPIVSNPAYEASAPDLVLREEMEAARRIEGLRERARAVNVKLDIQVRRGNDPHREIVDEAVESKTDLIVIRRRGKPGFLARMLVGEMVSRVIRDVSCCVLVVPRAAEFWQKGILAAVGDTPAGPGIAKIAADIAGVCDLPLTILSVAPDQASLSVTKSLNTLNVALASAATDKVSGKVVIGKPVEQVLAAVGSTGADLLVIGRQRYHLFPFGNTGIMQNVAGSLDIPTLVVPG